MILSPKAERRLTQRVARRILKERASTGAPFGLLPMTVADYEPLLAVRGGELQLMLLPNAFDIFPKPGRRWVVGVSLFAPEQTVAVAAPFAWSVAAPGGARLSSDDHDLFTVSCAFHLEGRRSSPSWAVEMEAQLSGLPGVWTGRPLRDLLRLAAAVWQITDPAPLYPVTPAELGSHARALYQTARRARISENYALAVPAFEEAVRLGSVAGDSETVVLGTIGLGNVAKQRGNAPRARAWYEEAERLARRAGDRHLRAMALHDQFSLAVELEEFSRAEALALQIERTYDRENAERFGHDVAYMWLVQGRFRRALPIFQATATLFTDPGEQMLAWGCAARAAGGCGDEAAFQQARAECERLFAEVVSDRHEAQARLNLARGAAMMGDGVAAEQYGRAALQLAVVRQEGLVRFEAESFLQAPLAHCRSLSGSATGSARQDALARRLATRLRKRAPGGV